METLEDKIVTIARYPNTRALLLQSMLQSEGIDCFLSHQNLLQAVISSGVEIKVRQQQVNKALLLIEQSKYSHGLQKEKAVKSLKNVRRILVPIDFSNASIKACNFALNLADTLKAEVRLLHVFYNPVIDVVPFDTSHSFQVNLTSYLHEIEQNARKQMAALVCEMRKPNEKRKNKVKISVSLINGIAQDEIVIQSRKYNPGLIVMGSRGMGNQSGGLIGSVTVKVLEKAEAPVLAVPENYKFADFSKLKNVLYATDFDNYDQIAISKLINLLHPFKISLHCVHISIGVRKTWEKIKMDSLRSFLKEEYPQYPVKFEIGVSDNIINGLECYMRNKSIDVIAMTSHSRNLLSGLFTPSVTKMIMSRINKPLFVIKASNES